MRGRGTALLAVLLVGLNLRAGIAAVGPVAGDLQDDLGLGPAAVSLLTSLPVLCFALAAPLASWAGARLGLHRAIGLGLAVVAAGAALRVVGPVEVLFLGTVVLGVGMTVGNVLVPAVTKRDFGPRAGQATGVFTASLAAGAALAAYATVALAGWQGWRAALAAWAVLAVVGLLGWQLAAARPGPLDDGTAVAAGETVGGRPSASTVRAPLAAAFGRHLRRPVAWALAVFLATQAAAFYALSAWLPTVLLEHAGTDEATVGAGVGAFHLLGILGTLLVPVLVVRLADQRRMAAVVAGGWVLGLGGLTLAPAHWVPAVVVLGLAQGAGISLALTLVVLRSADATTTRELSAFAQTVGYLLGGTGPLLAGLLQEATGGWTWPLVALVAVSVVMGVAGVRAGRGELVRSAAEAPAERAHVSGERT